MKSLLEFIKSKAMLKAVAGVAIAWVVIIGGSMLLLHLNSRPWSERSVPLVEGMMKDSAVTLLEEMGLVPVHLDSVFNATAVPGSILEQSPSEGSAVKSGRPIYITTYRVTAPDEKIGVYEGQDARLALNLLNRKGFKVTEKTEPNTELDGKVVRVEINGIPVDPELPIKRGTSVTLIVGEVVDSQVRIPWLKGLTLKEAKKTLSRSSLSVGYVEYGDSVLTRNDTISALVSSQFPPSSAGNVKAGTAIDLYFDKP